MDKTAALASGILQGIGGEQNIQRLENCMTRVRVEVHNDDQLDVPGLKKLSGAPCQVFVRALSSEKNKTFPPDACMQALYQLQLNAAKTQA